MKMAISSPWRTRTSASVRRRTAVFLSALVLGAGFSPAATVSAVAASYRAADDGAKIMTARWVKRYELDLTVRSPALGENRRVRILVPRTWSARSSRTWPTVYAFHGGLNNYTSWTKDGGIDNWYGGWDVMVVMPEGANGFYTDWNNDGAGGTPRWEKWHIDEVRQLVERNFHAGGSRAAIGLSSGGQGAITYAARHPGMFRSASSYSGVLSLLSPGMQALLVWSAASIGIDAAKVWGLPVVNDSNWAAHDPLTQLPRLRGTRLYVSSGTTGQPGPMDPPGKQPWDTGYLNESQVGRATQDFVAKAHQLGIPVTAHLYGNGSHSWPYWIREYHADWPAVMAAIGAKKF